MPLSDSGIGMQIGHRTCVITGPVRSTAMCSLLTTPGYQLHNPIKYDIRIY